MTGLKKSTHKSMPKQNRSASNSKVSRGKSTSNRTAPSPPHMSFELPMPKTVSGVPPTVPPQTSQDTEQHSRSRVGSQQLELLARSMEGAPKLALSLAKSREERERALKKWDRIAVMLNKTGDASRSGAANKTGRGWLRYWTDLKFKVRRKHAYLSSHRAGSVQLTPFERRLLRVLTDGDGNMLFPSTTGQREDEQEPLHTEEVNVSSIPEPGPSYTADSIRPANRTVPTENLQDPIGVEDKRLSQLRVESVQFEIQRQKELHKLEMSHLKEKHAIEMEILNLRKQKLAQQFERNREFFINVNSQERRVEATLDVHSQRVTPD